MLKLPPGEGELNMSTKYRKWLDYWQVRKRRYFAHLDHFRNDVDLFRRLPRLACQHSDLATSGRTLITVVQVKRPGTNRGWVWA